MWARGEPFDIVAYSTTANCLRRILETLGIKRVRRTVELSPMDKLKAYQQAKKDITIDG